MAKRTGVDLELDERGSSHTIVRFDGVKVTTLPRHNEINELTARSILRTAGEWTREPRTP